MKVMRAVNKYNNVHNIIVLVSSACNEVSYHTLSHHTSKTYRVISYHPHLHLVTSTPHPITSHHILSYPILSYPIPSHPIT